MTEINLKRCPFCGAEARMWKWNGGARIECSNWCVTDGQEHIVGIGAKTEEEAVRVWNERYADGEV